MISGCQGSHIFEVVFIRDRRQPTFTIVAEVNGSFFLFSQCSCHCYSFACDELSQVVPSVRGVLGQQHSTHRQRTQKTENCSLRCRRLLSCSHAPLGPRASLLTLKTAVWQTTPRSLKKNAAPATQATLIANGARSHMTPKRGKICHAMLRVTEETQKKN